MKPLRPTVLGVRASAQSPSTITVAPQNANLVVAVRNTGQIALSSEEYGAAEEALQALDFATLPASEIVRLGYEAEHALHATLDGFLTRLDRVSAPQVFALFDRLEKGVKEANLPAILEKVQQTKPSWLVRTVGYVRRKGPAEIAREAYNEVVNLITGKTKTLTSELVGLERELANEMAKLLGELQEMERLKEAYRVHISQFAVSAGMTQMFLENARQYVAREAAAVEQSQAADAQSLAQVEELRSKLQLLESRALALEATFTRLPADQQIVQQLQDAGLATLQETATTAASRFASIKLTLLALNGAFVVKGVQGLAAKSAALDQQLQTVRGQLIKEVVTTSANAPGDNRVAQAAQISKIIAETKEIQALVATARKTNSEKFAQARKAFEAARAELTVIS